MRSLWFLGSVALLSAACSGNVGDVENEATDTETSEGAASLSSTSTYYSARHDYRRCMYPMCGGYWVKRVNKSTTQCADGKWAAECYVAEIVWSNAGLDGSATGDLLRGSIVKKTYNGLQYGAFKPTEVWAAASTDTPSGSFYRVEDKGIVCVRAPCFDTAADKLNATTSRTLSDLSGTLALKAEDALATQKLIIAGAVSNTWGGGRALSVTQFWTRVTAKPADPLACSVDADCTTSVYNKEVTGSQGCYCTMCPTTIMNTKTEDYYRTSWEKSCSNVRLMCPMVMCIRPPEVGCVNNQCVAVTISN